MNKALTGLLVLALVLVIGIAGRGLLRGDDVAGTAPVDIGGPFTLVDKDGRVWTEKDLLDRISVIFFGYTYCPDVCPTKLADIGLALDQLSPAELENVLPVFITVDPDRDTRELVGEYVSYFHPKMVGLTGSFDQTDAAAKAYRAYYKYVDRVAGNEDYLVDHSSITYVRGPDGRFTRHFSYGTGPDDMAAGLRAILKERG